MYFEACGYFWTNLLSSRIYCFLLLEFSFSFFFFVCYFSGFELNFEASQMFTSIHAHFGCFSVLGVRT